jgi:PEP-CTERM motif
MKNSAMNRSVAAFTALILLSASSAAWAQTIINVDFGTTYAAPYDGTGVIGTGTTWNLVSGGSDQYDAGTTTTSLALVDNNGAGTSATLTGSVQNFFNEAIGGGPSTYQALAQNFGFNFVPGGGSPGVLSYTVSGLTDGLYNVAVYDGNSATSFTVNGVSAGSTTSFSEFGGSFSLGGNYVEQSVNVTDGTMTIVGTGVDGTTFNPFEADISGFQIQSEAVPEPSTFAMIAIGGSVLVLVRRLRQKSTILS